MNNLGTWTRRAVLASAAALALATGSAGIARPADASFTIAVLPDTQNYMDYTHQKAEGFAFDASQMFLDQMAYIAANTESAGGDIAFVSSLGDVWQHQSMLMDPDHVARGFKRGVNPIMDSHFAPTPKVASVEMPMARKGFEMIAGKVPFSVVPGNHDHDAMWTDINHLPAKVFKDMSSMGMLHAGGTSNFVSVFGKNAPFFKGQRWYIDSFNGGANSAQIFTAGGYRFLHIGLQFDPPSKALEWAAQVIRKHPGLPTIISTHDYMDNAGQRLPNPIIDNHAVDPEDNSPQMMWDKLISQHDQIFMVLCGHEHGQAFRTDDNRYGHKVYQVLSDYQDRNQTAKDAGLKPSVFEGIGDGWMRLMTFRMATATPVVRVATYSTHYRKQSRDTAEYAAWYQAHEKPRLTETQFHEQDDFSFDLTDFHSRFDKTARVRR
ncbi:MAG: metallophosphoesterase [Sphingomonadales bacterium]|nr:metallophosphoesterase [Sphingomonadales bacterium]